MQAEPIASIPMQKLTSGEVQSFYNELSPNAAKKMHVLLHSAFRKAKDLDMIRKNPIHMVQPPKAVKKGNRDFYSRRASENLRYHAKS